MVKNLPAVHETQETCVQSVGLEDPLEKEMATEASVIPWRIPWTEEPGGLQSKGSQRVRHTIHACMYFKGVHPIPEMKVPSPLFSTTLSTHKHL